MSLDPERMFHSLALTGGGYRGLFAASILQAIEDHTQKPVGRLFDLTCGTSIGGIVALAVAFEIPMSKVVDVFRQLGQSIFPPHTPPKSKLAIAADLFRHRRKPRYNADALREVITRLIPADATLGDALHPVAIPSVNVTQGRPQIFKTKHLLTWVRDCRLKVSDVALATSAAPTFFELAEVDDNLYADGGLFANAPDLVAVHEAEHFLGVPTVSQRVLSLGTTTKSYSLSYAAGRQFGVVDWMQDQRLFSVMISAQQQFVDQLMQHRLGSRYCRIDHEPSQEQAQDLGLDVATEVAGKTLAGLGTKAATDALGARLLPFLSHNPQLRVLKDS